MISDETSNEARPASGPGRALSGAVTVGFLAWVAISCGFFGLKYLMEERPEFVGQPGGGPKAELIQDSPSVVMRKMSDDVSVIKAMQPERSDVRFDVAGRRDYRGLRTVMDMSGEVRGEFNLTNSFDEPVFVLFKCPHPRNGTTDGSSLPASGLRLQSSVDGIQENSGDAWFWSGTLEAHHGANIDISYQVASLKGAAYHVGEQNGNPVKQLSVIFHRKDLESMRFASGDGAKASNDETVSWERRDFLAPDDYSGVIVESRSLYQSLSQLLEIGPGIALLFLLAVSAVILARQELNSVQTITIAVGYALYFPLVLYLSAHLSFVLALTIAAAVPGVLLLNYARWLLGPKIGIGGGLLFLLLYWVFPTLAAFAGWNRGMVLLCLGVVTLYVLIDLQNQALRVKAAAAAALVACLFWPLPSRAGDGVQVLIPGELMTNAPAPKSELKPSLVAFAPAQYKMQVETNDVLVQAEAGVQVLRAGDDQTPLFKAPIFLLDFHLESADTNLGWIVNNSSGLGLAVQHIGSGTLRLNYRVPILTRDGKRRAEIPVLTGISGNAHMVAARADIEILDGALWSKSAADKETAYEVGVTGGEKLAIEWRDQESAPLVSPVKTNLPVVPATVPVATAPAKDFYGIGLTRADHLTVVNSDGSCTHFAEFEMPAFQGEEFRMKLPPAAKLISASVNGTEIPSPVVEDQVCRVKLPGREAQRTVDHLSFRITYPPLRLGFIGVADLELPEVFQTSGTTEWVVALPNGFEAQVTSSGLETQKSPPDLGRFGDYGRLLQSHPHTYLAKDLAPAGVVIGLNLKYRQMVQGLSEARSESTP